MVAASPGGSSESFDTRAGNAHSLTSNEAHYFCLERQRERKREREMEMEMEYQGRWTVDLISLSR